MMNSIREIVIESFEINTEIVLEDYESIALKDLYIDSLGFINFIVDLEDKLSISLPEEYLIISDLPDLITFSKIIENLCEIQKGQS